MSNENEKAPTPAEVAKKVTDVKADEAVEAAKAAADRKRDEAAAASLSTSSDSLVENIQVVVAASESVTEAPTSAPAPVEPAAAVPAAVAPLSTISAAVAAAVAAPAEVTQVVFVPAQGSTAPVLKDAYALPVSASPSAKLNIEELKEFVAQMQPSVRLTPEQGGQQQTMFYQILVQAINTPAEDFGSVFPLMMKIIQDNLHGCFAAENMHRYTPHVTMPAASVTHFRNLLNAVVALADPGTRQIAVRQINVDQAFGDRKIKEESRQRVMSFFNL